MMYVQRRGAACDHDTMQNGLNHTVSIRHYREATGNVRRGGRRGRRRGSSLDRLRLPQIQLPNATARLEEKSKMKVARRWRQGVERGRVIGRKGGNIISGGRQVREDSMKSVSESRFGEQVHRHYSSQQDGWNDSRGWGWGW